MRQHFLDPLVAIQEARQIVARRGTARRELEGFVEEPLRLDIVAELGGSLREQPQRHDIARRLLQTLPQQRIGDCGTVAGERDDRITQLGGLGRQPVVARVGPVAFHGVAGDKELLCKLPPSIGEPFIERHGAAERGQSFRIATGGRIGAPELELPDGRVVPCAGEGFEQRRRRRRITELAARGGEQQARRGVPGRAGEDFVCAARGGCRIRFEQQRGAHELEIG